MTAVARNNFELRRVDRSVDFEAIGFDLDDSSSRTAGALRGVARKLVLRRTGRRGPR